MSEHNNSFKVKPPKPMRRGPGGGHGAMMPVEKAKDFKGSTKKLLKYMGAYKVKIILVVLCAVASTCFTIVGPKILAKATNELAAGVMRMITGAASGINFTYIGKIAIILIGVYLISAAFQYIQGWTMAGVANDVSYKMRNQLMEKINKLPISYFNKTSYGDVLSRITNDVDTLTQSLNQSITQVITSTTTVIGVLIMMLSISVKMTLIALGMLPVTLIFVLSIVKISQKHFKGQQEYLGAVNGEIEEIYGGHTVVKAFNGEDKSLEQFDEQNNKLFNSVWKAQFYSGLMQPSTQFVGNLGYIGICILGAVLSSGGTMTIGNIQAFIQYIRSFTQPITQLANVSNMLQQTVAAAERVFEFLEEKEEINEEAKLKMDSLNIKGDVKFTDVRFGYEFTDKIVIKDFSMEAKAGQKIAIVGPTGAGKTTLVKLLMRFHELKGGAIYIDGNNINDFDRHDLRTQLGMVLQDTWLFNGTIMDNIRYGNLNATDEEVIAAAKAAQVDHFVRTLPDGYNMILNEDASNVSQGQKQLLTIARAVLADNKVLILDEATSSVDTRTEILIQRAMDNLMKGRTSFIIAHRLSTIKNADLILFVNDGDIVEQGTHDELMALNGYYTNLYNSQFEKVS